MTNLAAKSSGRIRLEEKVYERLMFNISTSIKKELKKFDHIFFEDYQEENTFAFLQKHKQHLFKKRENFEEFLAKTDIEKHSLNKPSFSNETDYHNLYQQKNGLFSKNSVQETQERKKLKEAIKEANLAEIAQVNESIERVESMEKIAHKLHAICKDESIIQIEEQKYIEIKNIDYKYLVQKNQQIREGRSILPKQPAVKKEDAENDCIFTMEL